MMMMPSKIFNQSYNMFATLLVSHKWDPIVSAKESL